jgi:hypothetical protein
VCWNWRTCCIYYRSGRNRFGEAVTYFISVTVCEVRTEGRSSNALRWTSEARLIPFERRGDGYDCLLVRLNILTNDTTESAVTSCNRQSIIAAAGRHWSEVQ